MKAVMIDRKETPMRTQPFHAPLLPILMSGLLRRSRAVCLILCLLTLSMPGCSRAYQAITVCPSGCMFTSIQEGIAHAAAGDVVMIGAGIYQENIVLAAGVSLQGAGPGVTIIDGGQRNSVVRGLSAAIGTDVALTEMTLRNGRAVNGGGLLAQGASPTLRNLVIEDCQAVALGGGLAVLNSGAPALQEVTLTNNRAANGGGLGLSGAAARALMTAGALDDNSATTGGGAAYVGLRASLQLLGVELTNNQSSLSGGGVLFAQQSTGQIEDSTLTGNVAVAGHGGAVIIQDQANAALRRNTFRRNQAPAANAIGGAVKIYATGTATVTLAANRFENNQAASGGAVHIQGAHVEVLANTFIGNSATQFGGALVATDSTQILVQDNTFARNSAGVDGGALVIQYASSGQVIGNSFTDNRASMVNGNGGAIKVYSASSPLIHKNLIERNEAKDGGGLYIETLSASVVTQNTIRDNHSAAYGGGVGIREASPTLRANEITFNQSDLNGGGLFITDDSSVTLDANTISHNTARGSGGGLVFLASTGAMTGNVLTANQALGAAAGGQAGGHGGGMLLSGSNLLASHNIIQGNRAANLGGGAAIQTNSQPTLNQNHWVSNEAAQGGGIFVTDASSVQVHGNAFWRNRASESGGGLLLDGGSAVLEDNDLAFNQALVYGGGLLIQADAVVRMRNNLVYDSTFGNAAALDRSAIYVADAHLDIGGQTVVNNRGAGLSLGAGAVVTVTETIIAANDVGMTAVAGSQATLLRNDLWANVTGNYRGLIAGATDLTLNPLFATGPLGNFYLSQMAAGQSATSPLVDAGAHTAAELGLDQLTTRTDSVRDTGLVDLGIHYPPFTGQPRVWLPVALSGH